MKIITAEFVKSAVWPPQYPPGALLEIAFLGRSNVGTSSLITAPFFIPCLHIKRNPTRSS
jgi:GTP-binding protein EngB required for normal cell division